MNKIIFIILPFILVSSSAFAEQTIFSAITSNNLSQLKYKVRFSDPNQTDETGRTPLILATALHRTQMINTLLTSRTIDVEHTDPNGNTALLLAVESKQFDLVTPLLENGASPHHANNLGDSPLSAALQENAPSEVIQTLRNY